MEIRNFDKLNAENSKDLVRLARICEKEDGKTIKIYWEALASESPSPCNLLCYRNGDIIGYLSAFLFDDYEAEISAMTHPRHRGRGVFHSLFKSAQNYMVRFGVGHFITAVPEHSPETRACLKHLGGQHAFNEFQMLASNPPLVIPANTTSLTLRRAKKSEAKSLALLDESCFDSNYNVMKERFTYALAQENRYAWFAVLNGEPIGKIHVRIDDAVAYIHDLCILPIRQGKGHGKMLLKKAMRAVTRLGIHHFALDVQAENRNAIKLYENCGFRELRSDEYWRIE